MSAVVHLEALLGSKRIGNAFEISIFTTTRHMLFEEAFPTAL